MDNTPNEDYSVDEEFLDNNVRPVLDELLGALLTRRPEKPIEYITTCLNVTKEEFLFEDLCTRLSSLQLPSALFTFECNRAYEKLYEMLRNLRPTPLIGELTGKLLNCLLRSTYGKDLLLSGFRLDKQSYLSFDTFKRLLTMALIFKGFSGVCDQIYRVENISHVKILRYIADVIKSEDQRSSIQSQSFLVDRTDQETNSMEYDLFMQKALLIFLGETITPHR